MRASRTSLPSTQQWGGHNMLYAAEDTATNVFSGELRVWFIWDVPGHPTWPFFAGLEGCRSFLSVVSDPPACKMPGVGGDISLDRNHPCLDLGQPLPIPLWVCQVLGHDHIELEAGAQKRESEVPTWSTWSVSHSQRPPQQCYTTRKGGDKGEEHILPTQKYSDSGAVSLPSVHIVLFLLMQQPVDLDQ